MQTIPRPQACFSPPGIVLPWHYGVLFHTCGLGRARGKGIFGKRLQSRDIGDGITKQTNATAAGITLVDAYCEPDSIA